MNHNHLKKVPNCQNCAQPLSEKENFCPNCGQRNAETHASMHDIWHELIHYFTHVDNKIFITFRDVFVPAKLTNLFFKGQRKRYIPPVTLFFVMGIIMPFVLKKVIPKSKMSNNISEIQNVYNKDLLFVLDSTIRSDSIRFPKATRANFDTLLLNTYKQHLTDDDNDTTENGYRIKIIRNSERKTEVRKIISFLENQAQTHPQKEQIIAYINDSKGYLSKLDADSVLYTQRMAVLLGISEKDVASNIALNRLGYQFGKKAAQKTKKGKLTDTLLVEAILKYPISYDAQKAEKDSLSNIIARDSLNLSYNGNKNLKIDSRDIKEMSIDALFAKYNITSFRDKFTVKQVAKFDKQGIKAAMDMYISKSIWIAILAIVPSALCLLWLYRKQKRYIVEHVVFLIHYNCFTFVTSIFMIYDADWGTYLSMFLNFIFLLFAFKRFYLQSWSKTSLKFIIFYLFNFFISMIIAVLFFIMSIIIT